MALQERRDGSICMLEYIHIQFYSHPYEHIYTTYLEHKLPYPIFFLEIDMT